MRKDKFRREKKYQTTMCMARKMLKQEMISEEEYKEIDTIFTQKYGEDLCSIVNDIDLIKMESRANM